MPTEYERTHPWILPLAAGRQTSADVLNDDWLVRRVCTPNREIRDDLVARGFEFATTLTIGMRRSLRTAAVLLHEITSLETAVLGCVSRIVPLLAKPDYDISHSEPRWDALVFVTIPEGEDHRVALRSLENIIHEAMHIQLTRLERRLPLIADETATMRSPWRDEPRHFRGILHGVYVFACIRKSLDHLAGHTALDESGRRYISSRVAQIGDEVSSIDLRRLSAGMTPEGRRFIERLLVMN